MACEVEVADALISSVHNQHSFHCSHQAELAELQGGQAVENRSSLSSLARSPVFSAAAAQSLLPGAATQTFFHLLAQALLEC